MTVLSGLPLMGCDGVGFDINVNISSGDNPPDTGGGGGGGGGGTPPPAAGRFTGTWIASYGDDQIGEGANQYAVQINLTQDAATLSGTGRMHRVFRSGAVSNDMVTLQITGSASGDDGQFLFKAVESGKFDFNPFWFVRIAGNRMTGIYSETDADRLVVVSGHAVWNRVTTPAINDSWVSAFSDAFAAPGLKTNDRTGVTTLVKAADNTVGGEGLLVVQRENDVPDEQDFTVTRGTMSGAQLGFTFGGLDLAANEMDWFCFATANLFVGAYGQFNSADLLNRFGHATWYRSPGAGPEAVNRKWTTAFRDSATAGTAALADYLIVATLLAQDGGIVTGSAQVLNERDTTPQFRTFTVENGAIVGSRLVFDLVGPASKFSWDLRLAGTVMAGSYQLVNAAGNFLSRGVAEWRYGVTTSLEGTWTAAYVDTFRESKPPSTQHALVTLLRPLDSGAFSGSGTLRFAGENSRRVFSADGTRTGEETRWTWRGGTGTTGDTVWHLRQTGEFLHGTYTNLNSAGAVEARGHAIWFRSIRNTTP